MLKYLTGLTALACATLPAAADTLPPPPSAVYTAAPAISCAPVTLSVYFQKGESVLSQYALDTISAAQKQVEGCALEEIKLVSVTADTSAHKASSELAEERLALVEQTMASADLASAPIQSNIAPAPAAYPTDAPMARRVEIVLAAYQPSAG